jgi:hypothetical protein
MRQQAVEEHQIDIRQTQVVFRPIGQIFQEMAHFIAEISHRSAQKRGRMPGICGRVQAIVLEKLPQNGKRVLAFPRQLGLFALISVKVPKLNRRAIG